MTCLALTVSQGRVIIAWLLHNHGRIFPGNNSPTLQCPQNAPMLLEMLTSWPSTEAVSFSRHYHLNTVSVFVDLAYFCWASCLSHLLRCSSHDRFSFIFWCWRETPLEWRATSSFFTSRPFFCAHSSKHDGASFSVASEDMFSFFLYSLFVSVCCCRKRISCFHPERVNI